MENTDKPKDLIIAFLTGALAGGALAYFLQTEKGKALAEEAAEATKEKIKEGKELIVQTEEEILNKFHKALDKLDVEGAIEKGKEELGVKPSSK